MRKVIKILSKLILSVILLSIIIPLTLSVLLTMSSIQNRIVRYATSWASEYLDTRVDISSIRTGAFGRIYFEGVYVEDYQRDTLLFARKLDVDLSLLGLRSRELRFGNVTLEGGELNLRQTKDSIINIKQIIDRLTPQTPKKRQMKISFDNISLSKFNLRLERLEHRNPSYGVDYGDMVLCDMSAEVENLLVDRGKVSMLINALSSREKSGFELINLTGEFNLELGDITLTNTTIESRYSYIEAPYFQLKGASWAEYKDFVNRVKLNAQIKNTTLLSDDVAYFAPRLRDWGVAIYEMDADVKGEVNNLNIDLTHSLLEQQSELAVTMHATSLTNIQKSYIKAQIVECVTIPTDIDKLYLSITGKRFSNKTLELIEPLGELRYNGGFEGTLSNFMANFDATSELGVVRSTIKMDDLGEEGQILSGEIETSDFDLSPIIKGAGVGRLSLNATVEGDVNNLEESAIAYGNISSVEFRGEEFYDITYHGEADRGRISGEVLSYNKGFDFGVSAAVDISTPHTAYNLSLDLNDIDFKLLGLNKRDSISQLSTKAEISIKGTNIENIVGDIVIYDGEYRYNSRTVVCDDITIHTQNDGERKYVELSSDFADATFHSKSSYKESFNYLKGAIKEYLPALYESKGKSVEIKSAQDREQSNGEGYSIISVEVKDLYLFSDALVEGLQIANGSRADLMYNPADREFSLSMRSQYVELNSVLALDINLDASNTADSVSMNSSIRELLVGTRQAEDFSISCGASNNQIRLSTSYSDSEDDSSASIRAEATIKKDSLLGREAIVRLLPSFISQGEQKWDIVSRNIEISRRGVDINRFRIRNDEQELLINGLASRSERDTLRINMRNFDLSILSSITKAIGYNVEGFTSGEVTTSSALYNMKVEANILIDSVKVNSIPAPKMRLLAEWDASLNRADISLRNREQRDTLIVGYYIPSQAKYFAQVSIDSVNLALLDAPLKGVLTSTQGYANAKIAIEGSRREAILSGSIKVKGLRTRVGYTNVTYLAPEADVEIHNNALIMKSVPIYDTLNNKGSVDLTLSLKHLSNISYRVGLSIDNMLSLNTTQKDNELFYGKVFSSGAVRIEGDKRGVDMDITATTMRNSVFFMPLSNKSTISTAEFIKFVAPTKLVDTTDLLARKRLLFEASRQRAERTSGGNLNITMALNITPAADFQLVIDPTVGDVVRGRGEGQLNLRINPKSNIFDMYGDYTITEGSYLFTLRNIINKRFVINPSSTIQWSGDPLDANLNIEAVYKLKTSLQPLMQDESTRAVPVDCTILLTGKLLKPDVSFEISLPTADPEQQAVVSNLLNDQEAISRQFFYLMLANSFIADVSSGSDFGVSTTAATGFELLTNQLSNWLSSSNYNVIIRYRPESELAGDEVDLGISHSLINDRLLIEVEGNYTNDTSTMGDGDDPTSNFAGEAYITWLIDRSGALRLKGFTQTIDRFDENQGLQETGIGIYYRESFNNFQDLRQRVKARFSRRELSIIRDEERAKKERKRSKKKSSKEENIEAISE